jgi:hypothetical protein
MEINKPWESALPRVSIFRFHIHQTPDLSKHKIIVTTGARLLEILKIGIKIPRLSLDLDLDGVSVDGWARC